MMIRALFWLAALGSASPALASSQTDALSQCLVAHTNDADRVVFVRWTFTILSASPKVKDLAAIPVATRDALSADVGRLMSRLIITDCRAQTVAAIKSDGQQALGTGFQLVGQTAVQDLMTDPAVQKGLLSLLDGFDMKGLMSVMLEAGVGQKRDK